MFRSERGAAGAAIAVAVAVVVIIGLVIVLVSGGGGTPSDTATSTVSTSTTPGSGTSAAVPGVPRPITSSTAAPTDTTVVLTGSVNPNGALTSYWFEYGQSTSLGSVTPKQFVGASYNTISTPVYITGLAANTTYYYRLAAENDYGLVTGTRYSFRTTQGTPPPVGTAPTTRTLAATGVSRTTVNLNGDVDPNRAETTYWFEYGRTQNLGTATAFQSAGSGDDRVPVSVSLSGLDASTTYYFRLNSQNRFGTVNGSILNFRTSGPPAASVLIATTGAATTITSSTARLSGTVNPRGAETEYWFEYSTDSLLGSVLRRTTPKQTLSASFDDVAVSADVTGLERNTTYFVRLVAENEHGLDRGSRVSFHTSNN